MYNSVKGKNERIGRMLQMHANERTEVKSAVAVAGDIVALVGLKDTTTGETLCKKEDAVILEKMEFPEPVIKVAVEPKTKGDQQKMSEALIKLASEDPSFRFSRDEETGQTVIEGMGELHLEIIVDRMKLERDDGDFCSMASGKDEDAKPNAVERQKRNEIRFRLPARQSKPPCNNIHAADLLTL